MDFKIPLLAIILTITVSNLNCQNNLSPTHHSSGQIDQIMISGFENHVCQLVELVREINNNRLENTKNPLIVFVSFPDIVENFTDITCLKNVITANELKNVFTNTLQLENYLDNFFFGGNSFHELQINEIIEFYTIVDQKTNEALKNEAKLKEEFEHYFKNSIDSSIQLFWTNRIKKIDYVQDYFVSLNHGDEINLITPKKDDLTIQSDINILGENLASLAYIETSQANFNFDGGNIILTESLAIVGKDIFLRNEEDSDNLEQRVKTFFGVETVLFLGARKSFNNEIHKFKLSYQPQYHLDLFLNVIEKKDSIFFIFGKTLPEFTSILDKGQAILFNERVDTLINNLPEKLNSKYVVVDSIPLHLSCDGGTWLSYSFNNGLLEYYGNSSYQNTAYLPNYNHKNSGLNEAIFQKYQEIISATYTRLNVHNIHYIQSNNIGFYRALHAGASMHCLLKVLQRSIPYKND